ACKKAKRTDDARKIVSEERTGKQIESAYVWIQKIARQICMESRPEGNDYLRKKRIIPFSQYLNTTIMRNFIVIIGVLLSACTHRTGEIVPVRKILPVSAVIADSLYLSFPGQLRVTSKHILIQTPFSSEGFLKIYDRKTGQESGWTGTVGGGPGEWTAPSLGNVVDDKILIFDLNLKKYVMAETNTMYREISETGSMKKTDIQPSTLVFVNDRLLVAADYAETPFKLLSNGVTLPCGQYPFTESVTNTYERFQGHLAVHPEKRLIVYGTNDNPYISLYRVQPDGLEQVWEKQFKEADYSISDRQLRWGTRQPAGVKEVTFTKDYIACMTEDERNKDNTITFSMRGREMKIPLQSIYLFDYEGNLIYQLEPDTYIIRLASDTDSNLLYAVSIHPDFRIVTFDTDKALNE
ncbi:MAG: TolB-like 6-bladed beta-propeller domain-containing protein, partial [Tannerella sp.]|nr:TolB-like 6-bladed beta-propeller domain-containing protein [Tannerella sp.]